MIELLAFIAFFTFANVFAGGKIQPVLRQHGGPLPGRGIYYAGLAAIILGWFTFGIPGALAGLSFLVWRLPGWYGAIDAGLDPYNPERDGFNIPDQRLRDFLVMSARGLVAAPAFVYAVWVTGDWKAILTLVGASLGQGLVYDIAHREFNRNNFLAEGLSGAVWGVAYFILLTQFSTLH